MNFKTIYDSLLQGDLSLVYENKEELNKRLVYLLNKYKLEKDEMEDLKLGIMIGNITYNNLDTDNLPIDDGIYDLLIEKYRRFNNDVYPVGAPVIDYDMSGIPHIAKKDTKIPLLTKLPEPRDMMYPNLIEMQKMDRNDMLQPLLYPISGSDYIDKRKHTVSHNNPDLVGTFDKCKYVLMADAERMGVTQDTNVRVLERDFFGPLISKGIISPQEEITMIAMLKYDGVSVEANVSTEVLEARSRGDTVEEKASDMTPVFGGYTFPKAIEKGLFNQVIPMKFEAIINDYNMNQLSIRKNRPYSNCRTAIIGITSSSDAYMYSDLFTLMPLSTALKDEEGKPLDRLVELEFLDKYYTKGERLRYEVLSGNYISLLYQIKKFVEEAEFARNYLPFMFDGVVLEFYDPILRERLGRDNYIDRYKVAVKFDSLVKQTIFRGYTYTIGQNGSITPMIHYDPVEFMGAIHDKSSGHSYERFKTLDLHVGDVIDVKYVNDVMPYVYKPENEYNKQNSMNPHVPEDTFITHCPSCGHELCESDTGKTVYCINPTCPAKTVQRVTNMLAKIGVMDFGEESVKKLPFVSLAEYMNATPDDFAILGEGNKHKLYDQLQGIRQSNMYDYKILGALGFSDIAAKTWQLIMSEYDISELLEIMEDSNRFIYEAERIKGIGETTAQTIRLEFDTFRNDIYYIKDNFPNLMSYKRNRIHGKVIRFTGFRDKELVDQLSSIGHDIDDNAGVTKATDYLLVPFKGYDTGNKVKKAKSYGVRIIPVDEFKSNLNSFL